MCWFSRISSSWVVITLQAACRARAVTREPYKPQIQVRTCGGEGITAQETPQKAGGHLVKRIMTAVEVHTRHQTRGEPLHTVQQQ